MTAYNPGDVVLARFPFTNLLSTKRRPALIVSPPEYAPIHGDVVVLALTSQPQNPDTGLVHWREAGLPKPTWIKPLVATLSSSIIVRRLGAVHRQDERRVVGALRELIAPKFQPAGR